MKWGLSNCMLCRTVCWSVSPPRNLLNLLCSFHQISLKMSNHWDLFLWLKIFCGMRKYFGGTLNNTGTVSLPPLPTGTAAVGLRAAHIQHTCGEAPSSVRLWFLLLSLASQAWCWNICRESTRLNNYCFVNLSQCFAHLHNKGISGNILPMFPSGQQIYQELRKNTSSPVPGEGSFLDFVRTQDIRGDNKFVGPPGKLACCQAEHFAGDLLDSCIFCLLDATQG